MNDTEVINAGFETSTQSSGADAPPLTTVAPQPSESANAAAPTDQSDSDPAQVLWQTLQEDPIGTINFLVQHYGLQQAPPQASSGAQQPPLGQPIAPNPQQMDPWQQLVLNVALRMWQSEASSIVKSRAQEDELELSDNDLQTIFSAALEKHSGDIDSAYAAFAYPRLKARASQPKQTQEEKEPESGDLMSSIVLAGYR